MALSLFHLIFFFASVTFKTSPGVQGLMSMVLSAKVIFPACALHPLSPKGKMLVHGNFSLAGWIHLTMKQGIIREFASHPSINTLFLTGR
jgi:hypothetical protein